MTERQPPNLDYDGAVSASRIGPMPPIRPEPVLPPAELRTEFATMDQDSAGELQATQVPAPVALDPATKLDVEAVLADLEEYRPRRHGWSWRRRLPEGARIGPFQYREAAEPLERSIPLPAARYFGQIDPQPDPVITTEIASGRFEDDIRRMRMAAWHGADHIMVIRTAGQSHFEGLIEGSPEGVGGVPITRKQVRASRKALDLIEDEVGRAINFHSYISGVSGPEIAVLFAEEGVNGAHQDPQYNVLYRNVNMVRSFADAGPAKAVMAAAGMAQIDGAHNANATAREAWNVYPELMVQHAINTLFSVRCGMPEDLICLSTVPPTAPPAPAVRMDLPYAVALRELFDRYRMRAQMNTRYMESSTREAIVTHVLNLLISRLTSADIQSTITPDEGRNVPWHYYNVNALQTAKQALAGMDGLRDMVALNMKGELGERRRELIERAVLFLEEMLAVGGYFEAVARGFFVDSGFYPERKGDGIVRDPVGGVGAGTVFARDEDYFAPVCAHFGYNNASVARQLGLPDGPGPAGVRGGFGSRVPVSAGEGYAALGAGPGAASEREAAALPGGRPVPRRHCHLIGGCTLCEPDKVIYIDELDEEDNVRERLERTRDLRDGMVRPEVQWLGDGIVSLTLFLPVASDRAEPVALEFARRLGLTDPEVIHREVMHPAEGTLVELKGAVPFAVDAAGIQVPERPPELTEDEIRADVAGRPLKVVAATVGEDEHSVGLREIIDIKHGGLEKYGITCFYLGTSAPLAKLVDAAVELDADAILISTIISHADIHYRNMRLLDSLCREKGVRDRLILVSGGTQVVPELARGAGMDQGFGRGTKGHHVAGFLVQERRRRAAPPSRQML